MRKGDFIINIPKQYTFQEEPPYTIGIIEEFNVSGWFVRSTYVGECPLTDDSLVKDTFKDENGEYFHVYKRETLLNSKAGLYKVSCSLESFNLYELIATAQKKNQA